MNTFCFEFKSDALISLEQEMQHGYIVELKEERDDGCELVYLEKAAAGMLGALKMYIYADEHPPPHFHVKYQGKENSFRIDDASPLYPDGDLKKWFKNIKKWHMQNKEELIATWNRMRPEGCPVGPIQY
ncbi:DUF4160 domain-containing protein [Azovibrio restrictus]|uniref:DUF4160 domain-containing protein n=1 Tax=Azovibrio restrictus TaxID=146938 RepID=UPI0005B8938A|nr:DUF4160 domain-containing protein [Azovibrio restrictus]